MKKYKIIQYLILLSTVLFLISCSKAPEKTKISQEQLALKKVKFTEVMALEIDGDKEKILKINDKDFTKEESLSSVIDLKYNINNNVGIYLNFVSSGTNFNKTYISILNKNKRFYIKKDFSYMDMRISNNGGRLAFRSFSKDSLSSPVGVSVYSTVNGKKLKFDKDVVISGDLYRWQDNDNILYYGVASDEQGYGKIYSYDFSTGEKNVKFDKFQGYCTYFMPLDNGDIIYVENDVNKNSINYYDKKQNKISLISNNIDEIDDYAIDVSNSVLYYIGKEAGSSYAALYRINLADKKVDRITYDFPAIADKSGGMSIDVNGRVYFCGSQSESGDSDIYMYDRNNNSTNLVSKKSGTYHIVSQR